MVQALEKGGKGHPFNKHDYPRVSGVLLVDQRSPWISLILQHLQQDTLRLILKNASPSTKARMAATAHGTQHRPGDDPRYTPAMHRKASPVQRQSKDKVKGGAQTIHMCYVPGVNLSGEALLLSKHHM